MMSWRRVAARALMAVAFVAARRAPAQSVSVALSPNLGTNVSPAPIITVIGIGGGPDFVGASVSIDVSLQPNFSSTFFSRSASSPDLTAQFQLDSLMTQGETVYFRGRLIDRTGTVRAETVFSRVVANWVQLVSPAHAVNVLFTRRPTFTWSSPVISAPPGPWQYTVDATSIESGIQTQLFSGGDTSFVSPVLLDACTSYRWSITAFARAQPSKSFHLASIGTFVIQTADCPQVTFLHQNFPNPFGRGERAPETCFWFDLAHRSNVSLIVYDIRLRPVRTIVPGLLPSVLEPGIYGRDNIDNDTGCDRKVLWDGTDRAGRPVPPGVYIAVFKADGVTSSIKIAYKGR